MRIISKKKIRIYSQKNEQAELPLLEWYLKMLTVNSKSLTELRRVFNSVDYAHGYTIFNIGGNNYRLIASIHYNTQICYIRNIWSHAEYSKKENKAKLSGEKL
ncbi:MAG: type II toxin-antitoxin system HigB family toxin [Pseudomonadota bacterium]